MTKKIKGLWKVLFGRTTIFIVLLFIQIAAILAGFAVLGTRIIIANNIVGVFSIVLIVYLLNVPLNSSFRLMWVILITAVPILGVPFFIYTKLQPRTRHIARRIEEQIQEQREFLTPERDTVNRIIDDIGTEFGVFKYLYEEGHYPVYDNSGVKYFPFGEDKFQELIAQLKKAEKFIFMEYFIIDKGEVWSEILNVLREKARQGVEVRLLYDGTNTMIRLPKKYPKVLQSYGIQCKVFSPMVPVITTHQNNRDHRKIVVIDGHTGFTGGINLADEYSNRKQRFGVWKDTAVMIQGKAVNNLTLMFLQMWNIDTKGEKNYSRYMFRGATPETSVKFGGYIAPYGDSPLDTEEVGKRVYLDIINRSTKYVHIMTPYLIIDEEMTNALIFAAERGIDVKLILPHIPDKKYAYCLARSHYKELISGGVEIYEYTPGFVHAKNFVSDDMKAVVGTINMDFRSLFLHFECATYIMGNPVVREIEDDFRNTLKSCEMITLENCKETGIIVKLVGWVLRLVGPLM